jgi:hypothetical protein
VWLLFQLFTLSLNLLSLSRVSLGTFKLYIHRAVLICRASDAQLADVVVSPTFDPAPHDDGARVVIARGDGDGGEACQDGGVRGVRDWWHKKSVARVRGACGGAPPARGGECRRA